MALISNPAKRKGMTVLASDLAGTVTFDAKQTLPVMDMSSTSYDAGTNAYLKMIGVLQIDEQYNAAVKQFELQLQEQEVANKLLANFAAASGADRQVEAQPGLGTGAGAIASEGRAAALGSVHGQIEASIAEAYQTGIENMSESYQSRLESILGEYDEITGQYAGLTEYENIGMMAGEAIADALAFMINTNPKDTDTTESILISAGLAEESADTLTLTELGETMLKRLVNGIGANEARPELGGKTLIEFMAEQMAKQDNPNWDEASPDKQNKDIIKYREWLNKNFDFLRVSHWDMYEETDDTVIADIMPDDTPTIEGGTYVMEMYNNEGSVFENYGGEDLAVIKQRLLNGEIPDGAYFTIGNGTKYFYVKDNVVYDTQYSYDNPPDEIDVNSATVTSFGHFQDTGTGKGEQDKYVQAIIDKAKAGQLAEDTIVFMNYGWSTNKDTGWYQYRDGVFYKLPSSYKISVTVEKSAGHQGYTRTWTETQSYTLRDYTLLKNVQTSIPIITSDRSELWQ